MHADTLVRMVNDISDFFAPANPAAEAATEVAGHLQRSWEPRMRRQLFAYVATGGKDLAPEIMAAMDLVRKPADEAA